MRISNDELARRSLEALKARGVREWVVCPGARNGAWVEALKTGEFGEVFWHFEERAASFFALGKAKSHDRPVAIVTTSGTAVGELLPSAMEATHAGVPLVFLTADRPRRYRGTGAPQSCLQPGIFSHFVSTGLDLDADSGAEELDLRTLPKQLLLPVHVNVAFEDPKRPAPARAESANGARDVAPLSNPLVILGELTPREATAVRAKVLEWGFPVVTESLSQLREDPSLDSIRVGAHRGIWAEAKDAGYPIASVIRIGGVPTHRIWRDLEGGADAPGIVASLSRLPYSGTPDGALFECDLESPSSWRIDPQALGGSARAGLARWLAGQRARANALDEAFAAEPWSEPAIFRWISERAPPSAEIHVGNSSPIREWDLAASMRARSGRVHANRGLNGIDGQISTFFGSVRSECETWGIFGDLTVLYDLSSPWLLAQMGRMAASSARNSPRWRLFVINNSGGRIFERMFPSKEFLNEHPVGFEHWAKQWGLTYRKLTRFAEAGSPDALDAQVIEIVPDAESTRRFWARGAFD